MRKYIGTSNYETLREHPRIMDKIRKSDEEWRRSLTPEQYRILREKGTERPFTGQYAETTTPGVYLCAACGLELFSSETKFDAGCGWPSFSDPLHKEHVEEHRRPQPRHGAHRGHLRPLRRPSRPRLPRRPPTHRPALLHQLRLAPPQQTRRLLT